MDLSKYEAHPDDMQNCETASKMSNPDLALLSFPSASLPSSNLASAILQVPTMRLEARPPFKLLHHRDRLKSTGYISDEIDITGSNSI